MKFTYQIFKNQNNFQMFSYIFKSLNIVDLPFIYAKANLWFFLHVQVFKHKFSNHIIYLAEIMSSLKFKTLKVFFVKKSYEIFLLNFIKYILFILITIIIIL